MVEAEQSPFADASKAPVYSSVDLRALDSAAKARSFLAFKIKSFGMKNGTLEYRDKASTEDLKLQLEKIGEKKENIRRAVTI